jgi:hypothetical protein
VTDDPSSNPGQDTTPEPLPLYAPTPVPVPVTGSPAPDRPWARFAIAMAIVALAIAVLGSSIYVAFVLMRGLASRRTPESAQAPEIAGVPDRAVWAGGGRWAVAELTAGDTTPSVTIVAWDRQTKRTRTAQGFRLVTAETASGRVWLARLKPNDYDAWGDPRKVVPVDLRDAPGEAWVWDLDSDAGPRKASDLAWRPWAGPSGALAALTVDPEQGIYPNALSFSSRGKTVRAAIPSEAASFIPLGWSRDGRYFAIQVIELDGLADVTMFDASTGKAVALRPDAAGLAVLDRLAGDVPIGAAWDPKADQVWVASWDPDMGAAGVRLTPGGTARSVPIGTDQEIVDVMGTDSEGVLVAHESTGTVTVWRLAGKGSVSLGALSPDAYALGLGSARPEGIIADVGGDLVVLPRPGGVPVRIWPSK